jgi:phenylalanyl-tRNA synthetase beta chain
VFRPSGESTGIGWILTGSRLEHWSGSGAPVDFFDAKGIAELLVQAFGFTVEEMTSEPADDLPWFVPGRSARLLIDGAPAPVGHVGEIRPELVAARGLDSGLVVGGELDLPALKAPRARDEGPPPSVQPIPRYPSIVRDLSILVPERLPAAKVRGTIRTNAPSTLATLVEFDRYQGKGMPEGQVSLSMRLTFRDADRTLTDAEVQHAVDGIVAALAREHGATLRGK